MRISLFIMWVGVAAFLSGASYESRLISPDATDNLLRKQHPPITGRLTVSGDYNLIGYQAFNSPSDDDSSFANAFRIYGEWKFSSLEGGLVFKMEYRDSFGGIAPTDFGFGLGYAGMIHSTFSDQQARLTTLYWKQSLWDGSGLLFVGFLDVTEYVDAYLTASPWDSFSNLVFATGSATIGGLPDGAPGAMLGGWINEHWYFSAGAANANADAHDPLDSLDTFFTKGKFFSSFELGYAPSRDALFLDNTHLTFWHMDALSQTPEGWGLGFSWSRTLNEHAFAFVRGGWSDGGGALLKRSFSIGGAYLTARHDVIGVGLNIGRPNDESFPGATQTQYTGEFFYRWQVDAHLQITPSIQYIRNPALDATTSLTLLGVRFRLSF